MTENEILITLSIVCGIAAILICFLTRPARVKPTLSQGLYRQTLGRAKRPQNADTDVTRKTTPAERERP